MARNTEGLHLPLPPRPRMMSQQSNSLPSTPRQYAHDFVSRPRTPSPVASISRNPTRSFSSDPSKIPPSYYRAAPSTCRFMSTQTSRRRIPYTIGTDRLERQENVKATLDPHEEERLSGDMRELYDRLLPSADSQAKRIQAVDKLRRILTTEWPDKDIQVSVFGSSGNLLCTSESDVDVCVMMKELETTCVVAALLAKCGMQKVTCVHAKAVPIVKIWDPELQLSCDLNMNNNVALTNTRLIKTYIQIDSRVRPLAMIVKYWTSRRIINEASGGTLSSYTWTLLLINFLQTRQPPVLPVITLCDHKGKSRKDFSEDLELLHNFGQPNQETLGELLFYFFRHYGHELDYERAVVSVRKGKLLSKGDKGWQLATNNMLCVEEPFNTDRNLGNTADDTAFRGLHLEFRQAFERIAEAKDIVASVCEQYQFPTGEARPVFERPQPQPRPILSRSYSQSGRGGATSGSLRGVRSSVKGISGRRASSAAAYGQTPPPALQHLPQMLYSPTDYIVRTPHSQPHSQSQTGLQDQISQHLTQQSFQITQEQQRLTAQLLLNQASQLQHNLASHARGALPGQQRPANLHAYRSGRVSSMGDPPATAPLYPAYQYGAQFDSPLSLSQSPSHQGTDINPSSPLLNPSVPHRRGVQRGAATTSPAAAVRSQSQPPRQYPQQVWPRAQFHTIASSSPQNGHHEFTLTNGISQQGFVGPFMSQYGEYYLPATSMVEPIPREYLGYAFGGPQQFMTPYHEQGLAQIPSFDDLRRPSRPATPGTNQAGFASSPPERGRIPSSVDSPSILTNGSSVGVTNGDSPRRATDSSAPLIVNGSNGHNSQLLNGAGSLSSRRRSASDLASYEVLSLNGLDLTAGAQHVPGGSGLGIQQDPSMGKISDPSVLQHANGSRSPHHDIPTIPWPSPIPGSKKNDSAPPIADPVKIATPSPRRSPEPLAWDRRLTTPPRQPITLDLSPANHELLREHMQPQSALLSPVRESPTQSPTTSRKVELRREPYLNGTATNGNGIASSDVREQHPPPTPAPLKPQNGIPGNISAAASRATPSIPKSNPVAASNPWQQAVRKGKKAKGPVSMGDGKPRGEPLPVDEAERKGG